MTQDLTGKKIRVTGSEDLIEKGREGTVLFHDSDNTLLVEFPGWGQGHDGGMFTGDTVQEREGGNCWWVCQFDIEVLE